MTKAMGLNTIALYLMWNALETAPGQFDLDSGERDFVGFIRLCQQEGLWVYLRPGPYVCAEWTLGGLPPYLLREANIRLRDRHDARYMAAVERYIGAIAPRIAPLMASAGGPVLMLQIENEYSMHGSDVGYLQALAALWRSHGVDGPFSLAEGLKDLRRRQAMLPGAALGLDGPDLHDLQAATGLRRAGAGVGVRGPTRAGSRTGASRSSLAATTRRCCAASPPPAIRSICTWCTAAPTSASAPGPTPRTTARSSSRR